MLSLRQILAGVQISSQLPADLLDVDIQGITADSRAVQPGYLFVAIKGSSADGHDYLTQAMNSGAAAALVQEINGLAAITQVLVEDTRQAMALAAMNFYQNPGQDMHIIGITGTNGKTTTSYLLEALLRPQVGVIGTVGVRYAGVSNESNMTTPDPLSLARTLNDMKQAEVRNLVMEVSSHALEQKRVDGLDFIGAIFTNLSRDHLDYHSTMADYFNAKKRLFNTLLPRSQDKGLNPWAVINMEDKNRQDLLDLMRVHHINFLSYGAGGQVYAKEANFSLQGIEAIVETPQGQMLLSSCLVGEFNLSNLLAAVAAGLCLNLPLISISKRLSECVVVPGRLERITAMHNNGPTVLVDYAHTDDALFKALKVLRALTSQRLICVFGAGGNRDHGKRPLMGEAVAKLADLAIVTSDNPRHEKPMDIIDMIIPGLEKHGFHRVDSWPVENRVYFVEPEREVAINLAISHASPGDVVLIAGKGHESYQTVGAENRYFDDREKAGCALNAWSKDCV